MGKVKLSRGAPFGLTWEEYNPNPEKI